jgi:hypothetical protein
MKANRAPRVWNPEFSLDPVSSVFFLRNYYQELPKDSHYKLLMQVRAILAWNPASNETIQATAKRLFTVLSQNIKWDPSDETIRELMERDQEGVADLAEYLDGLKNANS